MTVDPSQRQPVPELALLLIGGSMFIVATVVKWDALFIASIFLCVLTGFAALISTWLSRRSRRTIARLPPLWEWFSPASARCTW